MRSALRSARASSPVKPSSMTLRTRAWLMISGRSQPEICTSVVYLRRASAKEPPIRPVPRMVARVMRCGDMSELTVDSLPSKAGKKITQRRGERKGSGRGFGEKVECTWAKRAAKEMPVPLAPDFGIERLQLKTEIASGHAAADGWGDYAQL